VKSFYQTAQHCASFALGGSICLFIFWGLLGVDPFRSTNNDKTCRDCRSEFISDKSI